MGGGTKNLIVVITLKVWLRQDVNECRIGNFNGAAPDYIVVGRIPEEIQENYLNNSKSKIDNVHFKRWH